MQLKLGAFIRKHPENLVSDDKVEDKIYYQHLAYIKVKKMSIGFIWLCYVILKNKAIWLAQKWCKNDDLQRL